MARWTRVIGDSLVHEGPCLLLGIIFWPDTDTDYVDIYDGIDASAGKKFCRVELAASTTKHLRFGQGVPFDAGIYVDGFDTAVETTIVLEPLPA